MNEQEALMDELERKSWDPIRDETSDGAYGLWESETNAQIDVQSLKSLFFSEDWVYILVNKIAARIAGQRLMVVDKRTKEPVENHPVQKLFDKPNEFQNYYQWMYSLVADNTICGNAVLWKLPTAKQIVFIPVERVIVEMSDDFRPKSYKVLTDQQLVEIPFAQIGHVKKPNPSSMYWGLSPFVPGKKAILFNRYSSEFLNNFYIKGAQPGYIIEILDGANEKEALRLLRGMELSYTGRKNQRRNMVMPKGTKATPAQTSLADQQLKTYIDNNRETILNLLEVPKHEVGLAQSGSLGSQEYKIAMKGFWTGPLKSTMDSITDVLNELLKNELGPNYETAFDLSDVDCLQEDEHELAKLSKEQLAILTPNEVRARNYKLGPVEGGDKLVGTQTPFGAQQFSMGLPQPTAVIPVDTEPTIEEKQFQLFEKNFQLFKDFKSKNEQWWRERENGLQTDFDRGSAGVRKVFLDTLAEQIEAVVPVIRSLFGQKAAYSKARAKKEIIKALDKFEPVYVDGNTRALEATIDVGYDSQLKLPFNLPDQAKIEAIKIQNAEKRRLALEDRQIETFARLNETTANNILTTIDVGIEDGKTITEIIRDVARQFTDIENVKGRAEMIARTETLTASSLGQWAAMKDASEVLGPLKKIWINAGDERVREGNLADHVKMQGQTVNHDEPFIDPASGDKLMVPRDPNGQAASVINCRCTFVLLPAKEAANIGVENFHGDVE